MNTIADVYILGIESSCDDTSAAVIHNGRVLSNIVANQQVHKAYGGVVPELASRAHQQHIIPVVQQALTVAKVDKNQLSAIAFTQGPGLLGSLLVGSSFAKSLATGLTIPLIPVHHMRAHLLVHLIEEEGKELPQFPFIGLTISGGHTQLVLVRDAFTMELIGETLDDAVGEAFDKSGKLLGLPYPAGPVIDRLAKEGNPKAFDLPHPRVDGLNFSFSGFKTGVLYFLKKELEKNPNFIKENLADLCASIQEKLVELLMEKIEKAVETYRITEVAIGGGVSANSGVRQALLNLHEQKGWKVHIPKFEYTTDNAAMIAMVGYLKYGKRQFTDSSVKAKARIPLQA